MQPHFLDNKEYTSLEVFITSCRSVIHLEAPHIAIPSVEVDNVVINDSITNGDQGKPNALTCEL